MSDKAVAWKLLDLFCDARCHIFIVKGGRELLDVFIDVNGRDVKFSVESVDGCVGVEWQSRGFRRHFVSRHQIVGK